MSALRSKSKFKGGKTGSSTSLINNMSPKSPINEMKTTFSQSTADYSIASVYEGTSMVGTLRYMAPEVIQGNNLYTKSVDIFSFGMLCYYCITRRVPFKGSKGFVISKKILRGDKPVLNIAFKKSFNNDEIYDQICSTMQLCWKFHAEDRPKNFKVVSEYLQFA